MQELYNIDPFDSNSYRYNISLNSDRTLDTKNKIVKYFDSWTVEIEDPEPVYVAGIYGCYRSMTNSQDEYYYIIRDLNNMKYIIIETSLTYCIMEKESIEEVNEIFNTLFRNFQDVEDQFEITELENDDIEFTEESTEHVYNIVCTTTSPDINLHQIAFIKGSVELPETVESINVNTCICAEITFANPESLKRLVIQNYRKLDKFMQSIEFNLNALETFVVSGCKGINIASFTMCYNAHSIELNDTIVNTKMNSFVGIDLDLHITTFSNLTTFSLNSFQFDDLNFVVYLISNSPNLQIIKMPSFLRTKYTKFIESEDLERYILEDPERTIDWLDIDQYSVKYIPIKALIMSNIQYMITVYS